MNMVNFSKANRQPGFSGFQIRSKKQFLTFKAETMAVMEQVIKKNFLLLDI